MEVYYENMIIARGPERPRRAKVVLNNDDPAVDGLCASSRPKLAAKIIFAISAP